VSALDEVVEQDEAKRLLRAALDAGDAHAFLLHGPAGTGKRQAAVAFAAAALGDEERVLHRAHPDLYVLEPLGDQIRIDAIRELRRDLHMRPFEAARRVYLIFGAELMNDEAADALLKDLEEPPTYARILLVADELGPISPTLRSRCQLVPFRRLSEPAVRRHLLARAPELGESEADALARLAAGRLDRAERLLDPDAASRRETLISLARAVYLDERFDPTAAAAQLSEAIRERGEGAKARAEEEVAGLDLTKRDAEQHVRRIQRGAEREELLASLEELATWYRDLLAASVGATTALAHRDRAAELAADASPERIPAAEEAAEAVRETWRLLAEFNGNVPLAVEALFVRLRDAFVGLAVSGNTAHTG
jgi:DNA polymerase-3 subunit delta'